MDAHGGGALTPTQREDTPEIPVIEVDSAGTPAGTSGPKVVAPATANEAGKENIAPARKVDKLSRQEKR